MSLSRGRIAAVLLLLLGAVVVPPVTPAGAIAAVRVARSGPLAWLSAARGIDPAIVDARGRQVLLRGVNLNHLGDYFSTDPRLPTVAPLGADDWSDVAATGANVVRLVTSWSAWEPVRGSFDRAYLRRVESAVDEANRRGIYVVIDLHQDAWSKFVFTPRGEQCPAGTHPQIGWDGAPAWATFSDGAATCTPGSREQSPAVMKAWDNFYADRDGVRTEAARLWGHIAGAFADRPGVAGFDLMNEPGYGNDVAASISGLQDFTVAAIGEIRAAERAVQARPHLVFFESLIGSPAALFDASFSDDPNLVFAPHDYAESIGASFPGLLELLTTAIPIAAATYGVPVWIGEYGPFGDAAFNAQWLTRFAALEDRLLFAGSTWWQWEQECGDPHDVGSNWPPSEEWVRAQALRCGDARFGARPCTDRAFPRAVPGRLTLVTTEPCEGALTFEGTTDRAGRAVVWFPGGAAPPSVTGPGAAAAWVRRVRGGWLLSVRVAGSYRVEVRGS